MDNSGLTILLVDDEKEMLQMMKLYLGRKGFRLIDAENAADALRLFHENRDSIDLLLFDIRMPRKNGIELYQEINRIRPDIPVIFMGGDLGQHLRDIRISGNNVNFLPKPFTPQSLFDKIHEVQRGRP